jgi:hypothetical protein
MRSFHVIENRCCLSVPFPVLLMALFSWCPFPADCTKYMQVLQLLFYLLSPAFQSHITFLPFATLSDRVLNVRMLYSYCLSSSTGLFLAPFLPRHLLPILVVRESSLTTVRVFYQFPSMLHNTTPYVISDSHYKPFAFSNVLTFILEVVA